MNVCKIPISLGASAQAIIGVATGIRLAERTVPVVESYAGFNKLAFRLFLFVVASLIAPSALADPVCLLNLGTTLFRVNGDGNGSLETFPNQPANLIGMTQVPVGISVTGCEAGDIIAIDTNAGDRLWRIANASRGVPTLVQIGTLSVGGSSIAIADGRIFAMGSGGVVSVFDPITFGLIGERVDTTGGLGSIGGLAYDRAGTFYVLNASPARLYRFANPPVASSLQVVGPIGVGVGSCGLEWFNSELWAGFRSGDGFQIGTCNTLTGAYSSRWTFTTEATGNTGFVAFAQVPLACDPIDFNNNSLFPEDGDLIDFLSILAGGSCSAGNTCNDIDFNNDGLFPSDDDLIAFLRVLAGGTC